MNLRETEKVLEETLKEMPIIFSSKQFHVLGRKKGLTLVDFYSGYANKFLKRKCKPLPTKRSWEKVEGQSLNIIKKEDVAEKEAVNLLKKKGYKVYKYVTKYEQV